jgi:hypothetical protein
VWPHITFWIVVLLIVFSILFFVARWKWKEIRRRREWKKFSADYSRNSMLLNRLALSCILHHGFGGQLGLAVPLLFPSRGRGHFLARNFWTGITPEQLPVILPIYRPLWEGTMPTSMLDVKLLFGGQPSLIVGPDCQIV